MTYYDCCKVQSKHGEQTCKCVSLNAGDFRWVFPENPIKWISRWSSDNLNVLLLCLLIHREGKFPAGLVDDSY